MFNLLAGLLNFFYSITHSYGLMIVLFTLVVMVVLTPFTVKSTRSMLEMQRLAPEIKKLQAKHKNDRQALNEAMMAFYQEHGVNPLGGCLPLLLQMPVFFIVNFLLRGLTHLHTTGSTLNPVVALGRVKGDVAGVQRSFDPKYLPKDSELYKSLVGQTHMKSFGVDLARSAAKALSVSFSTALPYLVLLAVMIGLGVISQRQLTARNPQAAQANPQQQMLGKIFPVFFGVISYNFFAGLVLYWTVQSAFRVVQQGAMYRWDPKITAHVAAERKELADKERDIKSGNRAPDPKPKGFFAQLKDAANESAASSGRTPGAKPGAKPRPSGNGSGGSGSSGAKGGGSSSNGGGSRPSSSAQAGVSGGTANRPQPGRQQPKKKRKGR